MSEVIAVGQANHPKCPGTAAQVMFICLQCKTQEASLMQQVPLQCVETCSQSQLSFTARQVTLLHISLLQADPQPA